MITEMITQKVKIDETHKIDTWLSFCRSELASKDYVSLEKHAESILEADKDNYMGWYYKGSAQVGRSKHQLGYESWKKCVELCHDKQFLADFYKEIPEMIFTSIYAANRKYSVKSDGDDRFCYAGPESLRELQEAFDDSEDFVVDDDDESYDELVFALFNKIEESSQQEKHQT